MLFKQLLVGQEGENTTKGKVVHKLFTVGLTVRANEGLNWTDWNKPEKVVKIYSLEPYLLRPEEEIIQSSINDRMVCVCGGGSTDIQ